MDKDSIASLTHSITIQERKNIILTGIKKIESFDNEEFLLVTTMGNIIIKGINLEIIKSVKENPDIQGVYMGYDMEAFLISAVFNNLNLPSISVGISSA